MASPTVEPAPALSGLATGAATATRLVSLDVFRGLTMASMVIVNNPGDWSSVYAPLLHAPWHGWTPTDLIFPFFLFIVGVSITLSRKHATTRSILRRAAIIFGLGLFLAAYPFYNLNIAQLRIPGVLQRIAVCYLLAALIYRKVSPSRDDGASAVRDDVASAFRRKSVPIAALAVALAVIYWAVMMLVPPPGGAAGDLSPEGNLGAFVDRTLMPGHLWRSAPGEIFPRGSRWDPEGLLSTIPALSTTLFGLIAGIWLAGGRTRARTAAGLAVAGIAAIAVGEIWNLAFPINKNLWTSSYAVFTAGAASVLLALCYWAIDVKGWRGWTKPFVILGTNAITLFVLSGLLVKTLALFRVTDADGRAVTLSRYAYLHYFLPLASPKNASLLWALANLVVLFAILAWMYRRRIFLRV